MLKTKNRNGGVYRVNKNNPRHTTSTLAVRNVGLHDLRSVFSLGHAMSIDKFFLSRGSSLPSFLVCHAYQRFTRSLSNASTCVRLSHGLFCINWPLCVQLIRYLCSNSYGSLTLFSSPLGAK
jgi:hypothetical protein